MPSILSVKGTTYLFICSIKFGKSRSISSNVRERVHVLFYGV